MKTIIILVLLTLVCFDVKTILSYKSLTSRYAKALSFRLAQVEKCQGRVRILEEIYGK